MKRLYGDTWIFVHYEQVCQKTKDLEKETEEWQVKWSQSNASLIKMEQNHSKLQAELEKAHDGLTTMTNLCKALQKERKEMLTELKREEEWFNFSVINKSTGIYQYFLQYKTSALCTYMIHLCNYLTLHKFDYPI